ncbi:unnamed protein product [Ixodes pacificus]
MFTRQASRQCPGSRLPWGAAAPGRSPASGGNPSPAVRKPGSRCRSSRTDESRHSRLFVPFVASSSSGSAAVGTRLPTSATPLRCYCHMVSAAHDAVGRNTMGSHTTPPS